MSGRVFYTENDSDSFADALLAIGAAQVFRAWLKYLRLDAEPIMVEDMGPYHQIALPNALDEQRIAQVEQQFTAGAAKPLVSKRVADNAKKEGRELVGFQYEVIRANRDAYVKQRMALTPADRARIESASEFAELRALAPPPDLPLYTYVNHFRATDGYNALLEQWHSADLAAFHGNLRCMLHAFSEYPNPLDEASAKWQTQAKAGGAASEGKSLTTRLQLINPASVKGANAPKASTLSIGGLSGFWLIEYLKFVGLFTLGVPVILRGGADRSKDRKTYVLRPTEIELNRIERVMDIFRQRLRSTTATKIDIVASLRFAETLIEYLRDALGANEPDPLLAIFGSHAAPSITNIARGFDVASYKDMGSAYATMNLATVNLPGWLGPITTVPEAEAALALLKEHESVISGIQTTKGEEGAEEYELLRRYRDYLSGHDLMRFLDFAALYGEYLLGKLHRKQWVGQFTTGGLDILMNQQRDTYARIVENEGFRAIATAIRSATVRAQYTAARERSYPYDVRYGLSQELLRAAAYPQDFLAALGAFIQSYNAENARIDERITKGSLHAPRRASVRTDHLDQIVHLIDAYQGNSELICKLLVAYGSARDPRVPSEQAPEVAPDAPEASEEDFGDE